MPNEQLDRSIVPKIYEIESERKKARRSERRATVCERAGRLLATGFFLFAGAETLINAAQDHPGIVDHPTAVIATGMLSVASLAGAKSNLDSFFGHSARVYTLIEEVEAEIKSVEVEDIDPTPQELDTDIHPDQPDLRMPFISYSEAVEEQEPDQPE